MHVVHPASVVLCSKAATNNAWGSLDFLKRKVLGCMTSSKSILCIRIIESGVSKRPLDFIASVRTKCAQDLFMSTSTLKLENDIWIRYAV
jgi:hypothetical protein